MPTVKVSQKRKKNPVKFDKMSMDNFMENMDASDSEEEVKPAKKLLMAKGKLKSKLNGAPAKPVISKNKKMITKKPKLVQPKISTDDSDNSDNSEQSAEESEASETDEETMNNEEKSYKQALSSLETTDPELYKFLSKNDKKLLKFGTDDKMDGETDDSDESEDEEIKNDTLHKPDDKLEVASDESDYEEDDASDGEDAADSTAPGQNRKVTLKMLQSWQVQLSSENVDIQTIRCVIEAFNSALASISVNVDNTNNTPSGKYRVEGAAIFNGVLQLCILNLEAGIKNFLNVPSTKVLKDIGKLKKFAKIKNPVRSYLLNLTKLLENVTSDNILTIILKHLHQFSSVLPVFQNITKPILKCLIGIWSTSSIDNVRVLSFLCILKITREQQQQFLNNVLKAMYLAYIKNSKFVSPNSYPAINFMRRSLAEIFTLDLNISYQHCFLYIRQLAIHLRNAVTLQKKDSKQMVYNWQYINSLKLWGNVLSITNNKQQLQPLIYPLVSIAIGVIKLIPNAQFFPLRFHCIQILIELSAQTDTFIPIMPFVLETLNSQTFMKPHKKVSMRPLNLDLMLRLQKTQLEERGFRDAIFERVYAAVIEILANESGSLAYPDMIIPCVVSLRQYMQKEKNSNYLKKLKQLLDKILENSKYIEQERKKITFSLNNMQAIKNWEVEIKNKGTPLQTFYESWAKSNEKQKRRVAIDTDNINDYDLPTLIKRKVDKTKVKRDGPAELFPSSDESETEMELEKPLPKKLQQQQQKEIKKKVVAPVVTASDSEAEEEDEDSNQVDIVKDLNLDDW